MFYRAHKTAGAIRVSDIIPFTNALLTYIYLLMLTKAFTLLKPRVHENLVIGQLAELFKCDWSIFSLSEIRDQFLALWTQGLKPLSSSSDDQFRANFGPISPTSVKLTDG